VRRVGETITVNAQLISTETGAHVWADRFEGERAKLGELQVEAVARLANVLGVELVRAEALRATRDRPSNPDASDLAMQAEAKFRLPETTATVNDAVALYDRALALDPQNLRALTGLAQSLYERVIEQWSDNPTGDIARGDKAIDAALAIQPDSSMAHYAKSVGYFAKRQWRPALAEAQEAIRYDRNYAQAHAWASFNKMFLGHSEDGFEGVETAFRLSPLDPNVGFWQFYMCHLHTHLAQWGEAIDRCSRAATSLPGVWYPLVDLVAANAWAGHDKEAKDAAAQLQKTYPGFTVLTFAGIHWTDDPTFNEQYQRIVEGLRKAGLPEGEKKTN
jgi:tetratricopeptide (TPR) repeat protein